jgi:glycosyltransferase involved in cell wall biosynthesis
MGFSVLMSVYYKEKPLYLKLALDSIINQTLLPTEVIIVKDGPLNTELDEVIHQYNDNFQGLFSIIALDKNYGLGIALNEGIKICKNDIIIRMDSDDISLPERFEKQIDYLTENEHISVIGSSIEEFNNVPGDLKRYRTLPTESKTIIKFSKYRNPLNHPTVAFRRKDILEVGSYLNMPLFEDYFLWVRLIKNGFNIANLPQPLLYFRIGNDMIGRRHGIPYLKKEIEFLRAIRKLGFINRVNFIKLLALKLPLRLLPKKMLESVYKTLLR